MSRQAGSCRSCQTLCAAMNQSRLFEELLLKLQQLINSNNEYEIIESSRVLRQLLLDGDALLHLVNRDLRASPKFNVRTSPLNAAGCFDPNVYPIDSADQVANYSLQHFLAHSLGHSEGKPITVRELIKYGAIILGAVHFKEDSKAEYAHISAIHSSCDSGGASQILIALKNIGAITRDALIPIRDQLLMRERFENGTGWTVGLSLRLLPGPPDEDIYILDIGKEEHRSRFSIYVDSRGELTFRIVDATGFRTYLRAGTLGQAAPSNSPFSILCEMSTVGDETLLSIRTDGWNHAEVVKSQRFNEIGDPLHIVTASDCFGRKNTHMHMFRTIAIARPLKQADIALTTSWLAESTSGWVSFSGNQFLYSVDHPNFAGRSA